MQNIEKPCATETPKTSLVYACVIPLFRRLASTWSFPTLMAVWQTTTTDAIVVSWAHVCCNSELTCSRGHIILQISGATCWSIFLRLVPEHNLLPRLIPIYQDKNLTSAKFSKCPGVIVSPTLQNPRGISKTNIVRHKHNKFPICCWDFDKFLLHKKADKDPSMSFHWLFLLV